MKINLPYGKKNIEFELPDDKNIELVECRLDTYKPKFSEEDLVKAALYNPIGTKKLSELAQGKNKVVIIASDHTRPVPSKIIMPLLLEEIRRGNPYADITILIATGCHRETTRDELIAKFGEKIVDEEEIVIHDATDADAFTTIDVLPSGGFLKINKLAANADLLVSEGFIEPHFFAGFSGGRKSVLPGIASKETVYWNHNAEFIASPYARVGILDRNPIHEDMIFAAKAANLAFICNVVINSEHKVIGAFAGDVDKAHHEGCRFLSGLCEKEIKPADIVITTNNGYPLDQNLYQAVKGMTTAEAACKDGGYIIICAACEDGMGGEGFKNTFSCERTAQEILDDIESTEKKDTVADQWQSQIFARVLAKHKIIAITEMDDDVIRDMKLIPAHDIYEALKLAGYDKEIESEKSITIIPQGISAIIKSKN